ncbi:MAG TPA: hypothetical protein VGN83_27170 [Falsiroseomonas sp.]|jgi:hypothetical protein|nr:hypothetical protein [Falsiroseomonas sp.]
MSDAREETLWARLRRHWLQPELAPRQAEEAAMPATPQRRFPNPPVGAWLR